MEFLTAEPAAHCVTPLPLVAAQTGIWMADKLFRQPGAWNVAYYVELNGYIDALLLARAVVAGMEDADTLKLRFGEQDGIPYQWIDTTMRFDVPDIIELRTEIDPQQAGGTGAYAGRS